MTGPARLLMLAGPFAVLIVIGLLRIVLGPGYGLLPLLSLGPVLAAFTSTGIGVSSYHRKMVYTACAGTMAIIAAVILTALEHILGAREVTAVATTIAITGISLVITYLHRKTESDLKCVRAVADVVQNVVLQQVPARLGEVSLRTRYMPADAHAHLGGDLYAVARYKDRIRIIIGDVRGKGLPAVRVTALVLGIFREASLTSPDLCALTSWLETRMEAELDEEEFVTAALAEINPAAHEALVVTCGHPAPLYLHDGQVSPACPEGGALPLGLGDLEGYPQPAVIPFAPGSALLFYTDGVTEARDPRGSFFPLEQAVALSSGMDELVDELAAGVIRHTGKQSLGDDAALLLAVHTPWYG